MVHRCDDIIVHVDSNARDYEWRLTVFDESDPRRLEEDIQAIEEYFKDENMLIIPRNFTERLELGAWIEVKIQLNKNGKFLEDTQDF